MLVYLVLLGVAVSGCSVGRVLWEIGKCKVGMECHAWNH